MHIIVTTEALHSMISAEPQATMHALTSVGDPLSFSPFNRDYYCTITSLLSSRTRSVPNDCKYSVSASLTINQTLFDLDLGCNAAEIREYEAHHRRVIDDLSYTPSSVWLKPVSKTSIRLESVIHVKDRSLEEL